MEQLQKKAYLIIYLIEMVHHILKLWMNFRNKFGTGVQFVVVYQNQVIVYVGYMQYHQQLLVNQVTQQLYTIPKIQMEKDIGN